MDALHRLQFQILQDDMQERWRNFKKLARSFLPKRNHKIGVCLAEVSQEAEARVWVEVGNEGLRLRVSHLHPANPSVADALRRKCSQRRESRNLENNFYNRGHIIYPPEDDQISLTSLEDYWFNHWQGPFITADTNQNNYGLTRLRRSCRISKRNNRCSMCHKKRVVKDDAEETIEGNCFDREENVLAHMPSVKLDARVLKDDIDDRSDDDMSKLSISEETLSRCSASEEQLSRVNRILENELRTSFTLFADEAVSQDVVDTTVNMTVTDEILNPEGFLAPPMSPRQSRSCPCSPKLSRRTCSPESSNNSPKSRSIIGSSKFSLSSSLLAIHRQASNTLMPEFFKFDSKCESANASKASSQHNSLRSESKRIRHTLSTDALQGNNREEHCLKLENNLTTTEDCSSMEPPITKCPVVETQSLPTLRLSKMSLTYRGGVIISEENEAIDTEKATASSASHSVQDTIFEERDAKQLLPDVVPSQESACSNVLEYDSNKGIINLGFDGLGESSDFGDVSQQNQAADFDEAIRVPQECQRASFSDATKLSESFSPILPIDEKPTIAEPKLPQLVASSQGHCADDSDTRNYNTFIEKDVLQGARDLVFWWRNKGVPSEEEAEFCVHETECKVKQKPLLMFLHGLGSSSDVWNQQLWYFLSCGYEVVAPDLLGHGMSSAPKDKKYYTFSNMLDYVSLVFDLFVPQGRKCIVVGHNYGCALAVALARGRPLSVGLVVLASCGGPNPLAPYSKYESSVNSLVTRLLSPFISCNCLSRELLYTPRGKHFATVVSDDKSVSSTPRYVVENTSRGQYWPEGDMAFHRRITIPTLLLHGMKDQKVSFVEMCEMEKTIPRAFLELIPGAGHELMTDSPTEVCHAMHRFIRRWKMHIGRST